MKTLVRLTTLSAIACGLLVCNTSPTQAQKIDSINAVLQAHLVGKANQEGKVQFRVKGGVHRSFEAHVHRAKPGQVMIVVLRRGKEAFKFAWMRADKQGMADLFLSTANGYPVPFLMKGDSIEIWTRDVMMMHGDLF